MAEGAHVANAWVAIIPSMEGSRGAISEAILPEAEAAGDEGGKGLLDKFKGALSGGFPAVATVAAAGFAAVVAAGAAVGKALFDVGTEFETMTNNIIIGTGASGEALHSMEDSAKAVATTVPTSFSSAGQTVADLNTRLGVMGDTLTDLATKTEALGKITGEAVDINTMTGAFTAFGVAAEDMSGKMDYMWGVSQATGVGMNELFGILETNAPTLTTLGFSVEESANMVGLLDKAGINASGTMSKMTKALGDLVQPGESAKDAFNNVVTEIQGYIDAGDKASALDLATDLFGTKGAAQFVSAVESGALSLESFGDAALGAEGDIMGTMEATMTAGDKWDLFKNKTAEALEPLAGALMDGAMTAMDRMNEVIEQIDPGVFESLGEAIGDIAVDVVNALADGVQWLVDHGPELQDFADGAAEVFSALGDAISVVVGFIGDFAEAIAPVIEDLGAWLDEVGPQVEEAFNSIGEFFGGLGDDIGQFVDDCGQAWDDFSTAVGDTWDSVCQGAEGFAKDVENTWDGIKTAAGTTFDNIKQTISDDMNAAQEAGGHASSALQSALSGDWDTAKAEAQAAFDTIKGHISEKLETARGKAVEIADKIGEKLGFPGLGDTVGSVFDTIQRAIEDPVGAARDFIDGAVQKIQGFFSGLKLELPPIKLPHFSLSGDLNLNPLAGPISVPTLSVEWYKTGGIFDNPTLIGVGEAGREAVVPLTNPYMDPFAEAVASKVERHGDTFNIGRVSSYAEFRRDAMIAKRYGGLECSRKAAAYGV